MHYYFNITFNRYITKTTMNIRYTLLFIFYLIGFTFLFPLRIHAYVDPSVMTYAIQAVAGVAIALGTFISLYWHRITGKFQKKFPERQKTRESDLLYFNDPVLGKRQITGQFSPQQAGVHTQLSTKKTPFHKKYIRDMIPAFCLSAAGCFMVLINEPILLYLSNIDDFWFDLYVLLRTMLKVYFPAVLLCMIGFTICWIIYDRLYQIAFVGASIIYLCFYIQSNFLAGSLPLMDGNRIDWGLYDAENLQSIILWAAISLCCILLVRFIHMRRFTRLIKYLAGIITVLLTVSLLFTAVQTGGFVRKSFHVTSNDYEFTLSDEKNLVILVLDAADSRTFTQMLNSHPEYQSLFEDFTYFPDTVGAYAYTVYAMPQILTGKWTKNEKILREFYPEALKQSPLFEKLKQQQYRMGLYEDSLIIDHDQIGDFENIHPIRGDVRSLKEFAREMLDIALFKELPYPLKKYTFPEPGHFYYMEGSGDYVKFSYNNTSFYHSLLEHEITISKEPCFRFIHIEGAHVPFRYDKDMNIIDASEGTYEKNMEAAMTITETYLQKMKDADVYDNSAIIIMADHGFHIDNPDQWGRHNPILLIKGRNEKHPFTINGAPLSYDDLQEIYSNLLEGKDSNHITNWKEGDFRERYYMHFTNSGNLTECVVRGFAGSTEALVPTGKVYNAQYWSEQGKN